MVWKQNISDWRLIFQETKQKDILLDLRKIPNKIGSFLKQNKNFGQKKAESSLSPYESKTYVTFDSSVIIYFVLSS